MNNSNDSRYPYTYAADYIREVAGYNELGMKLSRSDASRIRSSIALVMGIDDELLARRLADAHLLTKSALAEEEQGD